MANSLKKIKFSVRRPGIKTDAPTDQDQSTVSRTVLRILVKVVYDSTSMKFKFIVLRSE